MRIVSRWYDADHRVIYLRYTPGWTWDDINHAKQDIEAMVKNVDGEVHVISDLRGANILPSGSALSHLSEIISAMPGNLGILATLGGNPVLQTLTNALQKVTRTQAAAKIRYFSTLEEIHVVLEEHLQRKLKIIDTAPD